jgi:hypothetical protein
MSPLTTRSGRISGRRPQEHEPLDPEVAEAMQEVQAAEAEYEDACADGAPGRVSAGRKRLDAARATLERIKAGLRGRERREQQEAEALAERRQAAQRASFYEWTAERARRLAPVLELQQQLKEAIDHLTDVGPRPAWPGDRNLAHVEPWMPLTGDGHSEVAKRIPASVKQGQAIGDPTRTTKRPAERRSLERWDGTVHEYVDRGPEVEVVLMDGDDRFARLAAAIDQLAQAERDAAGDQAKPPRWA